MERNPQQMRQMAFVLPIQSAASAEIATVTGVSAATATAAASYHVVSA